MKVFLFALLCAVLLAACGGSGKSGARQAAFQNGLGFSKCMRAHGVTNFPDPGSAGGIQFNSSSGINPESPAFQAAQSACAKKLGGGPFRGQATEQMKQRMLRMSECMRAHGLANFPDPVAKAPAPGAGLGIAFGTNGSFIAIPQSMINSPGFNQAGRACGLPGIGPGGRAQVAVAPGS